MSGLTSTLTLKLVDDGLEAKAKADAEALKRLGASGDALKKLGGANPQVAKLTKTLGGLEAQAGKITAFRDAGQGLRALSTNLRAARGEIERTTAALAKQSKKADYFEHIKKSDPRRYAQWVKDGLVDQVQANYRAAKANAAIAKRALPAVEKAYGKQIALVRELRGEVLGTGAPIAKLASAQTALRGKIEATSAAIKQQVTLHGQAEAKASADIARTQARAQAETNLARAMGASGREAQAGIRRATAQRAASDRLVAGMGAQARASRQDREAVEEAHRAKRGTAGRDVTSGMGGAGREALPAIARREANAKTSRRMIDGMGTPSVAARAEREQVRLDAVEARAQARAERREAGKALLAGGAIVGGHKVEHALKEGVSAAGDYDLAQRKQKVFQDLGDDDQVGLDKQARKIGAETQFSNIDVVKAQTTAMQGLPTEFAPSLKAAVAQGIVQNVRNYATLMDTDLKEGTETIRGYLQQSGADISTKEKALTQANIATNKLVKMAKLGGMDGEDVKNFSNYALSSATAAGISPDATMALGALARRGGLRGDVAGVAVRSMASKISSPTSQGLAALNAAGIKYSDFVKMPEKLSTDALEGQFQNKLGKSFTPEIKGKLDKINADKDLIADRGRYVAAVTEAVSPILGKDKKGKVRASDSKAAAKATGDFHKVSAQSVDAEGLLDAAMTKGMTLPQLNAWLTDKHGGKAAITQRQWDEFKASKQAIGHAADDPDFAKKKADYVYGGLGGSMENARGSWENAKLAAGRSVAPLVQWGADTLGSAVDKFSELPQPVQATGTVAAGAASAAATLWGTLGLTKLAMGLGGKTAAAAAAESVAAGTTGAAATGATAASAGAAGAATSTAAGSAAGASFATAAGLGAAAIGTAAGAAFAAYVTAQTMPKMAAEGGGAGRVFDPGTGEALGESPMAGMVPSAPNAAASSWWGRHAPVMFGGDAPAKAVASPVPAQASTPPATFGPTVMPPSVSVAQTAAAAAGSTGALDGLKAKAGEVEATLKTISAETVTPKVDTGALDKVTPAAAGAKTALDSLNVAVEPKVDTSSITAAIGPAQQLLGILQQIQGAAGGLAGAVAKASAAAGSIKGRSGSSPSFSDGVTTGRGRRVMGTTDELSSLCNRIVEAIAEVGPTIATAAAQFLATRALVELLEERGLLAVEDLRDRALALAVRETAPPEVAMKLEQLLPDLGVALPTATTRTGLH